MRLAGGYKTLKKHAWFAKFDWVKIFIKVIIDRWQVESSFLT